MDGIIPQSRNIQRLSEISIIKDYASIHCWNAAFVPPCSTPRLTLQKSFSDERALVEVVYHRTARQSKKHLY